MERDALRQLFQTEFSKMVAVISKLYGLEHIETAEDIVSETFLTATETWPVKGTPPNPAAWLYAVAKQKTFYHFRRDKILREKVIPALSAGQETAEEMDLLDFSPGNIRDSQLQMLFAICDPAIASEAQIGLALRILCGFGIDEIAGAFLTNKETINKRLLRAKEKLRAEQIRMEMPAEPELPKSLDNVLHIIYLLFNEGYYSRTSDRILKLELCQEAMRLGLLLTEYEATDLPKTKALIALMCFHASRFGARQDEDHTPVLYEQQNEDRWDKGLINSGRYYLEQSAQGDELSSYHLEARIASWHCMKEDTPEKWEEILQLYNQLLEINYSLGVALNRTYALYRANGWEEALEEALKLKLESNHFYYVLLGELYRHFDKAQAAVSWKRALELTKTETERRGILRKISALGP